MLLEVTQVGTSIGLNGDYNDDGVVDAADYVMWRKLEGTSTVMPNDPNPLPIDNDQFVTWRGSFGETGGGSGGSGDGMNGTVPEPAAVVSVLLAVVLAFPSGRSKSCGRTRLPRRGW